MGQCTGYYHDQLLSSARSPSLPTITRYRRLDSRNSPANPCLLKGQSFLCEDQFLRFWSTIDTTDPLHIYKRQTSLTSSFEQGGNEQPIGGPCVESKQVHQVSRLPDSIYTAPWKPWAATHRLVSNFSHHFDCSRLHSCNITMAPRAPVSDAHQASPSSLASREEETQTLGRSPQLLESNKLSITSTSGTETSKMQPSKQPPQPLETIDHPNSDAPNTKPSQETEDSYASRPIMVRSCTEPLDPSPLVSSTIKLSALPLRPRNKSPYARTHLRSRSTASTIPTPMTRANSSPTAETFTHMSSYSPLARPASPLFSAPRRPSPLRRPIDESFSYSSVDIDQTIAENSELDITPRPALISEIDGSGSPMTPSSPSYSSATFPRVRRRPSSPLHQLVPMSPAERHSLASPSTLHTSSSSPALRSAASPLSPTKYNEAYPLASSYAISISTASSIPSTPTSFRSRSPSISSLETIPDSPDAELEAIEATDRDKDAIAKLKAAMEREGSHRGSLDGVRGRGMFKEGGAGQEKRKRWSVCGAERRGDLDLETIWED